MRKSSWPPHTPRTTPVITTRTTTITYSDGKPQFIQDPRGKTWELHFTDKGDLEWVKDPSAAHHQTNFVYDTYGLISPEVVERGTLLAGATPGHDRRVDPDFFFDQRPTYLGSVLASADAPDSEGLPGVWERTRYKDMVTIERCPLPESEGFPPGLELRLLRMHRWD